MSSAVARPVPARSRRGALPVHGRRITAIVGAVAVVLSVWGCAAAPAASEGRGIRPASPIETQSPETSAPPVPLAVGQAPAAATIPAIELSQPLIDLGIDSDGAMEVPLDFGDVGWFTGGGRPGGVGPTVIAGHVDSSSGPAVFFRLRDLVVGDVVQVTDVAGQVFDYEVTRVGDCPKAEFPTAEVFGATLDDELRLITCTGLFDRSVGHYEDNRIVFATRA